MADAYLLPRMRTERFAVPWELERTRPSTPETRARASELHLTVCKTRKGSPVGASPASLPPASSQVLGGSLVLIQQKEEENVGALRTQVTAPFDWLLIL